MIRILSAKFLRLHSRISGTSLSVTIGIAVCAGVALPLLAWAAATYTTVDSSAVAGKYTDTVIGTDGYPVISYRSSGDETLRVAKCANSGCTLSRVTIVDATADVGEYTSIAIGVDHFPIISYSDKDNRTLKVAKCSNSGCTTGTTLTTVDLTFNVGQYTSIAIGNDGFPVISYYANGDLNVAKCSNAACTSSTLTTVDSVGNVGTETSIAIGNDGFPVISYFDLTNLDLKVAHCVDAACTGAATLTTVDSDGSVGTSTSIAIGSDSFPMISYYDTSNGDLKVAHCSDVACTSSTLTTVDSTGDVGQYTSIVTGADGYPVIGYFDTTNADLKMATCSNATCSSSTITVLDTTGNVGSHTSIAIENDSQAVISYYDATNGDLKFALTDNFTDTLTRAPTLIFPSSSSTHASSLHIAFTLPEAVFLGTVKLNFNNGGSTNVAVILNDSVSADFTLGLDSLIGGHVATTVGGTSVPNGTYTLTLSYQDKYGHMVASDAHTTIVIARPVTSSSSSLSTVANDSGGSQGGTRGAGTEMHSALALHATQTIAHPAAVLSSSSLLSSSPSTMLGPARQESTMQLHTCKRVMKWFSTEKTILARVNARLEKRFGFTCGG